MYMTAIWISSRHTFILSRTTQPGWHTRWVSFQHTILPSNPWYHLSANSSGLIFVVVIFLWGSILCYVIIPFDMRTLSTSGVLVNRRHDYSFHLPHWAWAAINHHFTASDERSTPMSNRDSSAPVYSISQNTDDGKHKADMNTSSTYMADLSAMVINFFVERNSHLKLSTTAKTNVAENAFGVWIELFFLLFCVQGTLPLKELTICNLQQNCNHSQPQEFAFQINGKFQLQQKGHKWVQRKYCNHLFWILLIVSNLADQSLRVEPATPAGCLQTSGWLQTS